MSKFAQGRRRGNPALQATTAPLEVQYECLSNVPTFNIVGGDRTGYSGWELWRYYGGPWTYVGASGGFSGTITDEYFGCPGEDTVYYKARFVGPGPIHSDYSAEISTLLYEI